MAKVRVYPTIEHIKEVTAFKTTKQAEGALETLIWLDQGAPHKFDGLKGNYKFAMDHFITPIEETQFDGIRGAPACGTACCIAGAIWSFAHNMNGNKPDPDNDMTNFFPTDPDSDADYPDLQEDLQNLFYADNVYDLNEITAKEAAKTLRKYLKKGKVDWSHLED
jgi:hypothetical protein